MDRGSQGGKYPEELPIYRSALELGKVSGGVMGSIDPGVCKRKNATAMKIDRPVFIVAPHRSGTTLLYTILSRHPDVGYFNQANRWLRAFPRLAHLATRCGMRDRPVEAKAIWDLLWRQEDDIMEADDATADALDWYGRKVERVLKVRGTSRFLAKYPRFSLRLGWLDAVFPGCLFVHIVRDWRAVVSSTVVRRNRREDRKNPNYGGWFGMRIPDWRQLRELPHEIAAGRQYRITTQWLEQKGPAFSNRYLQVWYGDLCRDPVETVRGIAAFCDLAWSESFEASIPPKREAGNQKWRKVLDAAMLERIRQEDPEFFERHEEPEEPGKF
ncbi:MAG: sulfotransferase [Planctomycetota bacterium]|nr:sulfotransferase [Planctomycetota bacterium]